MLDSGGWNGGLEPAFQQGGGRAATRLGGGGG